MNQNKQSGFVKWLLITISVLFLFVMLVLPLLVVITQAFKSGVAAYLKAVTDKYTVRALLLTLEATLTAVVLYPILKACHIKVVFAVPGIILATVFVTFPFISRELIPVLETEGTDEEEAAALMGAGAFTIFRKITLPHIRWALLYGIVLCTARAMGEFGAVSVLSGHLRGLTNTLPLHVEILFNEFQYVPAFAVSSILVILAIILLVMRSVLEHKGKTTKKPL